MWVNDQNTDQSEECYIIPNRPSTNGPCWVEAGYTSTAPGLPNQPAGEYWYWADVRPGGQGYVLNAGPPLQPNDYGHGVRVYIFKAIYNIESWGFCSYLVHMWCVVIQGNQTGMTGKSGCCTGTQSMRVTDYSEGIEYFEGDGTANAPDSSYTFNQWQRSSVLHYQTNNGVTSGNWAPDFPAKGCWSPPPTRSSTGGSWLTYLAGSSNGAGGC